MRYKQLEVYQKSYELALSIYRYTESLPKEEVYGITSQIRRASLSIPLNIAEGYGKQAGETEFKRYVSIAKGSCNEVMVIIEFLRDLRLMEKKDSELYLKKYEEVEKMLYGLMKK